MERIVFTPETEVYIMNMHNPNKPLHGYIREIITMTEYDSGYTTYQYDVRVDGDDTDLNIVNKRVSLKYILYAKCRDNWYAVNDLIKAAETYYNFDKPVFLGKYFILEHSPCVKDIVYELEHNNVDCEMHNRVFCIKEEKIMESNSSTANYLLPGTKIIYYLPESLKTFIGYINKRWKSYRRTDKDLYYLVSGGYSVESISIVPEQILGYVSNSIWRDADTGSSTTICDIIHNFRCRFGIPDDTVKEKLIKLAINSNYGVESRNKSYYDIPTYDLSASYNKKKMPSPSDQLKKKLKRIEVNGEYMTAVWYDHPATVIKLSENDMYDTEKAMLWLLLKACCENNKSECDRILDFMQSKVKVITK